MGIQDRDYWRERNREQQGIRPSSKSTSPPSAAPENKRSFRIIDKVRVRPDNYVPDPAPINIEKPSSYGVGVLLVLTVLAMLGFFVYKVFF